MRVIILLLSFGLFVLSSCSKEEVSDFKTINDDLTNLKGWSIVNSKNDPAFGYEKDAELGGVKVSLASLNDSIAFLKKFSLEKGLYQITIQVEADTLENIMFISSNRIIKQKVDFLHMIFRHSYSENIEYTIQFYPDINDYYINILKFYKGDHKMYKFIFNEEIESKGVFGVIFKNTKNSKVEYKFDRLIIEKFN